MSDTKIVTHNGMPEMAIRFGVWGLILLFALLFSVLSLKRHATFQSNGFDLGNVNQAIWNTAQGRPMAFTNMAPVQNRLALHVEPILFFLVPFYWLGLGGPHLLLIIQAGCVAIGSWPLYLIARPKVRPGGAMVFCLAYLLYPALEAAVLYDFHAVTLAPTFLLFAFYWLECALDGVADDQKDKDDRAPNRAARPTKHLAAWRWFAFFSLLAMACKEDVGLIIAMLGLYSYLIYRRLRPALLIFGAGLIWSLIAIGGVQALFGGNAQGDRYSWLAEALTQPTLLWTQVWQQADLLSYLWGLFAPVAGLALFAPLTLLPILPSLAINLLSSHGLTWRLEEFHYAAPIAPFVFIAALRGIAYLKHKYYVLRTTYHTPRSLYFAPSIIPVILLLVASLTYHYYRGFTPLARPFRWLEITAHHHFGTEMASKIDPDHPLFAPLTLNPHVSSRTILHQTFDTIAAEDWLWLDIATLPNEHGIQQRIRDDLLPNYDLVQAEDGYLLLKPRPDSPPAWPVLPDAFHTYARPPQKVSPHYSLSIFFGEALELLGYDLIFNRAEEVQVRTYWQAHQPLPNGLTPTLYLLDETGAFAGAVDSLHAPATLIWYPTSLWPLSEVIVVHFNSLNWYTRDRVAYRLALGVSGVADPWDVGARWQPDVRQSDYAPYLTPEGTTITLAYLKQVAGLPEGGPLARQMRPPPVRHPVEATFGEQVRLLGYSTPSLYTTNDERGVQLDLVWQGLGQSRADYVRFVHVVGPDGVLRGQHDSAPITVNGSYPTSLWVEGEFVTESIKVPININSANDSSDTYTLHVGLYDPRSGQRLLNERGQDHIEIFMQAD